MTLHTKYRPRTLEEVLGQEAIVRSLSKALEKHSSQTFLLHGPSGVGKTTIARIAAKQLDCMKPIEIDAATHSGVEEMRVVTKGLDYPPFKGATKVVIVDEAHGLSASAWNSILKSTEEPPKWVYWFLCTTALNKVPATIKTRFASYQLKPVKNELLTNLLNSIIKREELTIKKDVVELCVQEAGGSPRQAIVNLEICADVKSLDEAADLLATAGASPAAIDLARLLLRGAKWKAVSELLRGLRDVSPESVRHVVRAYMTNVVLSSKNDEGAGQALEILDAFSTPFPSGDGISPLVLACGRLLLSE